MVLLKESKDFLFVFGGSHVVIIQKRIFIASGLQQRYKSGLRHLDLFRGRYN